MKKFVLSPRRGCTQSAGVMGNTIQREILANLKDEILLGWSPIWVDRRIDC